MELTRATINGDHWITIERLSDNEYQVWTRSKSTSVKNYEGNFDEALHQWQCLVAIQKLASETVEIK